jgi:uncharacterized RDD family membrane protein YckC
MECVNHPAVSAGLVRCRRCQKGFCRNCVVALRGQYYCARCKADQVRDIQSGTEAGVLELATIGRRFGAQWVDGLVFMLFFIPAYVLLALGASSKSSSPDVGVGLTALMTLAGAALIFLYEGLMLSSRGQTLGKMAVGIKVVTPEGRDIDAGQAWGRAFVRQVFFSYFALIDILPAVLTKQRTAVHDLAAKTRVVRFRR